MHNVTKMSDTNDWVRSEEVSKEVVLTQTIYNVLLRYNHNYGKAEVIDRLGAGNSATLANHPVMQSLLRSKDLGYFGEMRLWEGITQADSFKASEMYMLYESCLLLVNYVTRHLSSF